MHELIERLEKFGSPRVALVGDFMLDRYIYGDAERVSPEAPVPILKTVRTESRTGGAGNVAAAIHALGGQVVCVGVVGQDAAGEEMSRLLVAAGAQTHTLVKIAGRSTTVKARYVGLAQHRHAQQMLRVDDEVVERIPDRVGATLRAALRGQLRQCQAMAIEDYDKGLLDETLTPQLIEDAIHAGLPVLVDPARISDYRRYRGCTLLTPNRYEAELASGIRITDQASLERAARQVILSADAQAVVVTLDKEGAFLMTRDGKGVRVPTRPRAVYDVTGAGDEVLAMLAVALAEKCPLEEAVALSNVAGGLEVERFGVVPILRQEVIDEIRQMVGLRGSKVQTWDRLKEEFARRRRRGETVVFTNGCFDLLHVGHLRYLREARSLGSCLVVAVNTDNSVRRLKGPTRPIVSESERAEMLSALECVDYVTLFEEDTPEAVLHALRPDVLVKGGTTSEIIGRTFVESYGGKVMTLCTIEGRSTTNIVNRILSNKEK